MKSVRLVSIAILRPPGGVLTNTVKYLEGAGALVSSFTKTTDLVAHIAKEIPDCVFVSTEYPADQVQNTLYLITQVLKIPAFGFSKNLTHTENQMLQLLPFSEIVKSDISGPIAEKMVLGYFEQLAEENKKNKKTTNIILKDQTSILEFNQKIKRELISATEVKKEIAKADYQQGKNVKVNQQQLEISGHFLAAVKETVNKIKTEKDSEFIDDQLSYEISLLTLFEFRINNQTYTFIIASLDDKEISTENINSFTTLFIAHLKSKYPDIKSNSSISVVIPRARIRDWLTEIGFCFTITSLWQRPCYLGVISNSGADSFGIKSTSDPNFFEIPITSVPLNIALPYSVHILLSMNQKYFPYLTKGNFMTSKALAKLSSSKINSVYLAKSELTFYLQRLALKNVSETLYGYLSKNQAS